MPLSIFYEIFSQIEKNVIRFWFKELIRRENIINMKFVYSIVYNEFIRAQAQRQHIKTKISIKVLAKEVNYKKSSENMHAKRIELIII
jgi:hypothetical protein